ncbi:MAG: leucine-rich repeat domain-containing protein [Acidobacteriota bacterium]
MITILMAIGLGLAAERPVAEWVLRQGGRVLVEGQTQFVAELRDLPTGELLVRGVDLYGTIIEPKDLEKLSALSRIRELYLPGPSWNPGAGSRLDANEELKFLAGLRTLEKLHFSLHFLTNVNVQDKGLKHLEGLTELRELRLAQGRIKNFSLAPFQKLEGLDLSYSTATDEVLKGIAGLKTLRRLNLRDTLVTSEGLKNVGSIESLEELDLYGMKIGDQGLGYLRNLKRLRKLNLLGGPISDESSEVLAGFVNLRELNLYRAELTNAGVARLAALKNLEWLDLRYTQASATGVEKLRAALPRCRIEFSGGGRGPAPSATLPAGMSLEQWIERKLRGRISRTPANGLAVSLAGTAVTDEHLGIVARLPDIEELDLEGTEIGDLGMAPLRSLKKLKRLRLDATTVSEKGLAALPKLTALSVASTLVKSLPALPETLEELNLNSTAIGAAEMAKLGGLGRLKQLRLAYTEVNDAALLSLPEGLVSLDLTGTDIQDAGLGNLRRFTHLEDLRLNHTRFTEKGFAQLAALGSLWRLEVVRTRMGSGAAETLAQLQRLRVLNADYTALDDAGLARLGADIEELRLDSTNVTDAAVETLEKCKRLRVLNLYHTTVSEQAHQRLKRALPAAQIIWDRDSKQPNRRGS